MRSSASECFPRWYAAAPPGIVRTGSFPSRGSTRTTSAPRSASISVQNAPGNIRLRSSTRIPWSGRLAASCVISPDGNQSGFAAATMGRWRSRRPPPLPCRAPLAPCLHRNPPITPAGFYRNRLPLLSRHRWAVRVLCHRGRRPRRAGCCCIGTSRSSAGWSRAGLAGLDTFFSNVSGLASTRTVLVLGPLLALARVAPMSRGRARRCRRHDRAPAPRVHAEGGRRPRPSRLLADGRRHRLLVPERPRDGGRRALGARPRRSSGSTRAAA